MLSPTLTVLTLDNIPSLVELPSSFQNLNQLKYLYIIHCRNLETLPSGINFQYLDGLSFNGCSRLRSFPEISTNISILDLDKTGIEEVPWRIEKFSNLIELNMNGCSKLKCVSLNISKLKHLEIVDFSNCGALTGVDLSGYPSDNIDTQTVFHQQSPFPKVDLRFLGCFNLDPETVLLPHQSWIFKSITLSAEEVPSYFTHRTTGSSSLTIPLLHVPLSQPFFRFRVGAVLNKSELLKIKVNCEFKGRFGNSSDFSINYMENGWRTVLAIGDCRIPLNEDNAPLAQRNYDQVDMHITVTNYYRTDSTLELKGWGIRVLEECSLPENRLPHVCELDEDNLVNTTEHSEECVEAVVKRQREIGSDYRLSEGPLKKPRLCPASDPGHLEPQKKRKKEKKCRTGSMKGAWRWRKKARILQENSGRKAKYVTYTRLSYPSKRR